MRTGVAETNAMISEGFKSAQAMGMAPYYMYRQKNIAGNLENVGYASRAGKAFIICLLWKKNRAFLRLALVRPRKW